MIEGFTGVFRPDTRVLLWKKAPAAVEAAADRQHQETGILPLSWDTPSMNLLAFPEKQTWNWAVETLRVLLN